MSITQGSRLASRADAPKLVVALVSQPFHGERAEIFQMAREHRENLPGSPGRRKAACLGEAYGKLFDTRAVTVGIEPDRLGFGSKPDDLPARELPRASGDLGGRALDVPLARDHAAGLRVADASERPKLRSIAERPQTSRLLDEAVIEHRPRASLDPPVELLTDRIEDEEERFAVELAEPVTLLERGQALAGHERDFDRANQANDVVSMKP